MFFISPPRPRDKIHPRQLSSVEAAGKYFAQPKYDGDRRPVAIEGSEVVAFNRHGKEKKIGSELRKELLSLKLAKGFSYLDGEFLSQQGVIVLFDVLCLKAPLIGVGQMDRLEMLTDVCHNPQTTCLSEFAYLVTDHIWLAPCFFDGFREKFLATLSLTGTIEGLLLRKKVSFLDSIGHVSENTVDWQLRCRQPTKNYRC
jgi:hypothetical protein